MVDFPLTCN